MTERTRPNGFSFFTGLCIFWGAIGFLSNLIFALLGFTHGMTAQSMGLTSIFWLSVFHLFRDGGLVYGGVVVKKRKAWARNLVLLCAGTSLLELFYNTAVLAVKGGIRDVAGSNLAFLVIPAALGIAIIAYFSRKEVREFLS